MKLLQELYRIPSPSGREQKMIRFITAWLKQHAIECSTDRYGNIYAVKGHSNDYPCLVCHTDEVHTAKDAYFETVNFRDEIIFGYNSKKKHLAGTGADDKNGIWICLKCLEECESLKCAFFSGEERGCLGSSRCDLSFFRDCRFVVQCDRQGKKDMVTSIAGTSLCSDTFIGDCRPRLFGYRCTTGMATDVYALKKRGLAVSCVNLSCGYYNPHSDSEYTVTGDLMNCFRFAGSIIEGCTRIYPHKNSKPANGYHGLFDNPYGYETVYYGNSETIPGTPDLIPYPDPPARKHGKKHENLL